MAANGKQNEEIHVGILSISDSYYNDTAGGNQGKGKNLRQLVEGEKIFCGRVVYEDIVGDDRKLIAETLIEWSDVRKIDLILTSGGTGFSASDVTPEATKDVIDKEAPGMTIAMIQGSLNITPMAMLSRLACGIRGSSLIINLPGSFKGSEECLRIVAPSIPHAIDLLRGSKPEVVTVHKAMLTEAVKNASFPPGNRNTTEYQHHVPQLEHCYHHHRNHDNSGNHHASKHGHNDHSSKHDHHHQHHHASGDDNHHKHDNHHDGRHSKHHHHSDHPRSQVDSATVAYRARESPYPIISVKEALSIVLENSHVTNIESVNIKHALGRYLAEDIFARDALPPFPASIKDGYAVLASDGAGLRTVIGGSTAGDMPKAEITSGNCMRINTGAPLPPGADAVIQVEDTILTKHSDDGHTEIEIELKTVPIKGQDIRRVGSDIMQGSQVLSKGQRLGPAELGLLATVGVTIVRCCSIPVVGVMSTGDELVEPDQQLTEGKIRDSNRTTLISQLTDFGVQVTDLGIAPDTPQDLMLFLKASLQTTDIIVTTGGVSMGEKDFVKQVLETDFKATIHFARVFMKPGKPTTFATLEQNGKKKLFFSLPGNPVSALVTCNLYIIPSFHKMIGSPHPNRTVIKVRVSQEVRLDPRPEYHRAVLSWEEDNPIPLATSTGNQISSRLLSLSSANGLLMLPPKSAEQMYLNKGDIVDAMIIGRL